MSHLSTLNVKKSIGPVSMLGELASIVKPGSITFESPWWSQEVPSDQKNASAKVHEGRSNYRTSTGQLAPGQFLGQLRRKLSWKPFPSAWRPRKGLGMADMDLPTKSRVWSAWLSSVMKWLALWTKGEQQMSLTLALARFLVHSPIAP